MPFRYTGINTGYYFLYPQLSLTVCTFLQIAYKTSVYPAKGRPGSGSTKLASVAQKRLRRSRIEGYGSRPQARAWLAQAAVISLSSAQASWRRHAIAHASARGPCGLSQSGPFSQFLHIKGQNFPDFFIRSRLRMTPMNRPFLRNPEDRHTDTDRRGSFIYIVSQYNMFSLGIGLRPPGSVRFKDDMQRFLGC